MRMTKLLVGLGCCLLAGLAWVNGAEACQGALCEHCYETNTFPQGGENEPGGLWTYDAECCLIDNGGCMSASGGIVDWFVQGCTVVTVEGGWRCHEHNTDYSRCGGTGGGGLPGGGGGGSGECEIRYGEFCPMSCAFGCTLYY